MSLPIESALQSLEHPKNPETTYGFSFKDYMAVVSAEREDVKIFLGAVANDLTSKLPLQIDAICVLSGYSEFDAYDRHDRYAQPGPAITWGSRHLDKNPNMVTPEASDLEAYYTIAPHARSSIELATNPNGTDGQHVKLWGGSLMLKGSLEIPNSPELAVQITAGYTSPHLSEVKLWAPGKQSTMSSNVITLERVYANEPLFLEQPYHPPY